MAKGGDCPGCGKTNPHVEFKLLHVVCRWHGEPFRQHFPKGYVVFMTAAFQKFIHSPDFTIGLRGDIERVEGELARRPLCCWMTEPELMELYGMSGVGKDGKCVICKAYLPGTPFLVQSGGKVTTVEHVCFGCVVYDAPPEMERGTHANEGDERPNLPGRPASN